MDKMLIKQIVPKEKLQLLGIMSLCLAAKVNPHILIYIYIYIYINLFIRMKKISLFHIKNSIT